MSIEQSPPPTTALSLRGPNSQVQLNFESHPAVTVPYKLTEDEFCYLPIGDAILVCDSDGSYLRFGPEDGVRVVRDNAAADLRFEGQENSDLELMRRFNLVFLVAASIDRLPDALVDYLNGSAVHRQQAIAVARKLLSDNGGNLCGAARGGTFAVQLHLTDLGRSILMDATQYDGNPHEIYRVAE